MTLDRIYCPLCKSPSHATPQQISYSSHTAKKICFCAECGLGLVVPAFTQEELDVFYKKGDYWGDLSHLKERNAFAVREAQAEERIRFIERFRGISTIKSILDMGAGEGAFLGSLVRMHRFHPQLSYWAVEADKRMFEHINAFAMRGGALARVKVVDDLALAMQQFPHFDLVVLSHILEHLPEPDGLLAALKKGMKAGSGLFLELPFRDYRFRKDLDGTGHVTFWGPEQLNNFLKAMGFEVHSVEIFGAPKEVNPANPDAPKRIRRIEGVINLSKRFLPASIVRAAFRALFGLRQSGAEGIWLRAYATLK